MSSLPEALQRIDPLTSAPSAEQLHDEKNRLLSSPVFPPNRVFVPVKGTAAVVSLVGQTAAIAETTVALSTVAGLVVPPNTAAIQLRVDLTKTAGTGSASVSILHGHGLASPLAVWVDAATHPDSVSGLVDINGSRVTYQAFVTGTVTYSLAIYATAFVRSP